MKHVWRICPPPTASTPTCLTAPQHLSPTQPSQAPNFKAWLPTVTYSHSSQTSDHISPLLPKEPTDCHWTYSLIAKTLLFKEALHHPDHGLRLIIFPIFPLQAPAAFAPTHSSAENTLYPDSHSSLPHFRGLPGTPNLKAHPLSLHLYTTSFSLQWVLLPDINPHIQACV